MVSAYVYSEVFLIGLLSIDSSDQKPYSVIDDFVSKRLPIYLRDGLFLFRVEWRCPNQDLQFGGSTACWVERLLCSGSLELMGGPISASISLGQLPTLMVARGWEINDVGNQIWSSWGKPCKEAFSILVKDKSILTSNKVISATVEMQLRGNSTFGIDEALVKLRFSKLKFVMKVESHYIDEQIRVHTESVHPGSGYVLERVSFVIDGDSKPYSRDYQLFDELHMRHSKSDVQGIHVYDTCYAEVNNFCEFPSLDAAVGLINPILLVSNPEVDIDGVLISEEKREGAFDCAVFLEVNLLIAEIRSNRRRTERNDRNQNDWSIEVGSCVIYNKNDDCPDGDIREQSNSTVSNSREN